MAKVAYNTLSLLERFLSGRFEYAGGFFWNLKTGERASFNTVQSLFLMDALEQPGMPQRILSTDAIDRAMALILSDERESAIRNLSANLPYSENETPLKRFTDALSDNPATYHVFRHWMADILNCLHCSATGIDFKTTQPPMINLYSANQGLFKSTLVRRLLEPLGTLALETSIPAICATQNYRMPSQYLVLSVEELERASRSEIRTFKQRIFAPKISGRPLYTNSVETVLNTAHYISSANLTLSEALHDATGNRRYFDIEINHSLSDLCQTMQPLELWRSVSPGYFPANRPRRC